MDREAYNKGKSYYIGKHFFKAMLPRDIYANIGSLKQEEKRAVISLYFNINGEGLIDYDTISYRHSVIKNQHKLSYAKVNGILSSPTSHPELPEELKTSITQLNTLMQKRSEFRIEVANPGDQKSTPAESMVEELMLISHTCLPVYYDRVL